MPVAAAAGRVLAEDVRAAVDLPPFPSSAMDGFAVRAADTPGRLPVVFRIAAGDRRSGRSGRRGDGDRDRRRRARGRGRGRADRDRCRIRQRRRDLGAVEPGAHVRPRGRRRRAGDVVLAAGTRLGPAQVGALAAAGVAELRRRAPAARRRAHHRDGAARAGRAARPRGDLRVERRHARGCARSGRRRGRAPRPVADDADAHREALERGSRPTCSSAPAVSRSARTTSSARWWPSSGSRRSSGAWRSSRGSRSRSASAADAGLRPAREPGVVARRRRAVRAPAVLALQGASDRGRRTRPGRLAARCAATRAATSSCAPAAARRRRCCSSRSAARSRT